MTNKKTKKVKTTTKKTTFGMELTPKETIITIPEGLDLELSWKNDNEVLLDFVDGKNATLVLAKGINLLLRLGDNQIRIPKESPVHVSIKPEEKSNAC